MYKPVGINLQRDNYSMIWVHLIFTLFPINYSGSLKVGHIFPENMANPEVACPAMKGVVDSVVGMIILSLFPFALLTGNSGLCLVFIWAIMLNNDCT